MARSLDVSEEVVLEQSQQLKDAGIVRRISALINYRAIGRTGTLVAAHIPQENLQQVAEAVNSLESVSHNYLRSHYYNLWFTLQADSTGQIEVVLANLSSRFDVDFYSLPVERIFKLDVRFDAHSEGQVLLQDVEDVPESQVVQLNDNQKLILSNLQKGLDLAAEPFDFLCTEGMNIEEALQIVQEMVDKGVIRRIAAVVDHRRLGFTANVLFAGKAAGERVVEAGGKLARFGIVSHCYQRKTVEGWPYNLFAMMHGRSMGEIQRVINKFVEAEKIDSFELLPTEAELKKQPVRHRFG